MRAVGITFAILFGAYIAVSAIPDPNPLPAAPPGWKSSGEYWRTHCIMKQYIREELSASERAICRRVMP